MSKIRSKKRLILIILGVIGFVALVAVLYIAIVIYSFLNSGSGVRHRVDSDYKKISLPSDLKYQGKTETGDPLDSPDSLGWDYQYATTAKQDSLRKELISDMRKNGFTISEDKESADFTATKSSQNLSLDVSFSPGVVHIYAKELRHE